MIFKPHDERFNDSDEPNDFFENTPPPEEVRKPEPRRPEPKPEDPDYWEEEESEFEHLAPSVRNRRVWLWLALALAAAGVLTGAFIYLFVPYETEAVQYGYVDDIRKQGVVFKTYEGVLVPYKELMDTTRCYKGDFRFTAADPHVAARLKRLQLDCMPARVEYRRYHTSLPWRGTSAVVVTAVDTADPSRILPPEYRFVPVPDDVR